MELLYIWIKKFGNIANQGFNFSGEYIFNYSEKTNELLIDKNPEFINNFFNIVENTNLKISSLSAIIGENGSGKSSILNFIKQKLTNIEGQIDIEEIILLKKEGNIYLYANEIFKDIKLESKIENFNVMRRYTKNGEYSGINEFNNISCIFISNIFDNQFEKYDVSDQSNLLNISTNFLLHKDYIDFKINYNIEKSDSTILSIEYDSDPVIVHKNFEIKRQLYFYTDFKEKLKFHFDLPNELKIKVMDYKFTKDILVNNFEKDFVISFLNLVNQFDEIIYADIPLTDKSKTEIEYPEYFEKKLKALIGKGILINFLLQNPSNYRYFFGLRIFNINFDFDNNDVLERLLDVFENEFKNFTYDIDKDSKKIINYENLLLANTNFLKFLIPFIKENISNENEIIYSTDITDKKSIFDFIDSYLKTKPSFDFLNYKFLWSLSSGQNAFLNIFSRIYELINRDVNRFSKLKNNIILMIDEGDVCFHPQWQKEYLNTLLNFLPFIFERESKDRLISLQIILTSSSPIVISDIPRNNIIFLQRNSDGKCEIIEHLEDKKQTFSSNIHTLFSDSFFMKDGLIGEFAKKKINSVIKDLDSNEKLSDNRIEEIKKIISVIGEPIVKRKLMQMLEDKSKLDINYKERLSQIEEELKNLRERNDKN